MPDKLVTLNSNFGYFFKKMFKNCLVGYLKKCLDAQLEIVS